jgi:hypothetical protein
MVFEPGATTSSTKLKVTNNNEGRAEEFGRKESTQRTIYRTPNTLSIVRYVLGQKRPFLPKKFCEVEFNIFERTCIVPARPISDTR